MPGSLKVWEYRTDDRQIFGEGVFCCIVVDVGAANVNCVLVAEKEPFEEENINFLLVVEMPFPDSQDIGRLSWN